MKRNMFPATHRPSSSASYTSNNLPRTKKTSFRLLMMGGVSPKTC